MDRRLSLGRAGYARHRTVGGTLRSMLGGELEPPNLPPAQERSISSESSLVGPKSRNGREFPVAERSNQGSPNPEFQLTGVALRRSWTIPAFLLAVENSPLAEATVLRP